MEIRVQLVEAFLKQCGSWGSSSWPKTQQGPLLAEPSHWFHAFSFDLAPLQVVPPTRPLHRQYFPNIGLFKCCPRSLPDLSRVPHHSTQFFSQHFLLFGVTLFTP